MGPVERYIYGTRRARVDVRAGVKLPDVAITGRPVLRPTP